MRPSEFEPATIMFDGRVLMVRFSPMIKWVLAPNGAIIAGASDRYRFEVRHPQGQVLVVERRWEPVPIQPDERELVPTELDGLAAAAATSATSRCPRASSSTPSPRPTSATTPSSPPSTSPTA